MCVSWERARVSARAKGQRSSGHVACCCAKEHGTFWGIWDDGTSRSQFITHICKEKCARAQTSGAAAWEEGVWCKQHVSSIKIAPNNSHLVVYDNHWLAAKPNLSNFANPSRQQLYGNSVSVCVCVRAHACVCLFAGRVLPLLMRFFLFCASHGFAAGVKGMQTIGAFRNKFPPTLDFYGLTNRNPAKLMITETSRQKRVLCLLENIQSEWLCHRRKGPRFACVLPLQMSIGFSSRFSL